MKSRQGMMPIIDEILALDVICGDYTIKSRDKLDNNWLLIDVETCYGLKKLMIPENPEKPDYKGLIIKILERINDKCSIKYRSRGVVDIISISPRSIVAQLDNNYTIKVLTLLEDDVMEYKVLEYLTNIKYPNIPRLSCSLTYDSWQVAIITDYIDGTPLASEVINYAQSAARGKPILPGLIGDVGKLLADLHNALYKCAHEWCKPEIAGNLRAEKWLDRIRLRAKWITKYSHVLKDPLLGEGAVGLLDLAYKLYDPSILSSRIVFRIHGDMHLYQLYKVDSSIMITDFEGEPYKEPGFKNEKEPPERDLAALIRSIDYATVMAIMEKEAMGLKESLEHLNDDLLRWEYMVAQELIESYIRGLSEDLQVTRSNLGSSLLFWLVERISYEILYEIRAKTGLYHIPLNAVLRMSEGRDPIMGLASY
ncbi:MAG: hypothetical protein GSR85_03595 [Desulfurococcales archaeon]|nr:hypothetical protein [Desulfurococcales archaeon]